MAKPADVNVRYAGEQDLNWLVEQEKRYVPESWIKRCLGHEEYVVALDKQEPDMYLGYVRFSMFWGKYPYLDMISVIEGQQRRGIGHALYLFWEDEMRKAGHDILMTSSLRDLMETQSWHWRNGFKESGKLVLGTDGPNPEIFFVKELVESS